MNLHDRDITRAAKREGLPLETVLELQQKLL